MLASVEPSVRYEGPRAGYSSVKRPLSIPSGRLVNPRLEQELPTDDVKGLGRRKIPTSSQHPTRGTNVAIVYARVSSTRSVEQTQMNTGDVLFVCKSNTMFGTGTDRFSRCATLRDVNDTLKADRNKLSDVDPNMTSEYVKSRGAMLRAAVETSAYNLDDYRMVNRAQTRQRASKDYDASMDRDMGEVGRVTAVLADAEAALATQTATEVCPEFDWMAVPALREWRPDGVLLGVEQDDTVLKSIVPHASTDDRLLNICVSGPCAVRNQKLTKVPQFFDDSVSAGDMLYLCVVAIPIDYDDWEFRILPVSSRQLQEFKRDDEPAFTGPGGIKSDVKARDFNNIVAAWQLGRVVDDKLVRGQHARLLVHVDIKLMTRSGFIRKFVGDDGDPNLVAGPGGRIRRPPPPPPPPPPVPQVPQGGQVAPPANPARNPDDGGAPNPQPMQPPPQGPVVVPTAPEDNEGAEGPGLLDEGPAPPPPAQPLLPAPPVVPMLPAPPNRPLLLPPPGQNLAVAANLIPEPNEELIYNLGLAARSVASEFATTSRGAAISPVTWKWMTEGNRRFPTFTNATITTACQTYTLRTLESRPRAYQSQYAAHALYMTEAGFLRAIDRYVLTAGPSVIDYNDNCYLFSLMNDNGLTHELCVAFNNAKAADKKTKLFPMDVKPAAARANEDARNMQFNLLSFELPPMVDDAFSLAGLIDMKPFVERAPGNDIQEKTRRISFSLNLLFDLPVNNEWVTPGVGFEFIRSATDMDLWDTSRSARADYITDVALNSNAMGTDVQSSNYFLSVCCFAILNVSAISASMVTAMKEVAPPVYMQPESLAAINTGSYDASAAFDRAVELLPPQGPLLQSFGMTRLTDELALRPFARFQSGMPRLVPMPVRAGGLPLSNQSMSRAMAQQSTQVFETGEERTVAQQVSGGVLVTAKMVAQGTLGVGMLAMGAIFMPGIVFKE